MVQYRIEAKKRKDCLALLIVFKQKCQTCCEAGTESHGSRGETAGLSHCSTSNFRNAKPVAKQGRKATGLT